MDIQTLTSADLIDLFTTDDPFVISSLLPQEECDEDNHHISPEVLGLALLDEGACATIIAHPNDADRVIRVCEETDGWIAYACGEGPDLAHRPRVFSAGWTGECWVAVVERLHLIPEANARMFIDCVNAALIPGARAVPSHHAKLAAQDALDRNLMLDDLEPRNIMMRENGEIVMNDPLSMMTYRQMRDIQVAHTIQYADTPSPI